MARVDDVAAAILQQRGRMATWKLQKLVYYAQAWHLVWDDVALFPERIEAWANGPVVPHLYRRHRGSYQVATWPDGNPETLSESEKGTIAAILDYYGGKTGYWLSQLTHSEPPWKDARRGLAPGERGEAEITKLAMATYYSSLV